ncbi:MAG: glucose 1-dehydrogenase [Actinobacteria bacterium]|nr:glucose 1-dehydrogenase [Actinomycetota bacterium]
MGTMDGRVALVTGGARGQGAAIARCFVREGARVVVGDVLDDLARSVAASLGDRAMHVHLDVTDEASWTAAASAAVERFGPVDALVNNAGVLQVSRLEEMSLGAFRDVLDVNLVGAFLGIRTVAPLMRAAGGGTIVNTSSVAGAVGMAGLGAYAASKSGIGALTKCAAIELAADHIRVNAIVPGRIDTEMGNPAGELDPASGIPIGRIGSVDDVAAAVLFLSCDASSFCTGSALTLDGGATAGVAVQTRTGAS